MKSLGLPGARAEELDEVGEHRLAALGRGRAAERPRVIALEEADQDAR